MLCVQDETFIGANKISKDFELRDFILISPVVARHCVTVFIIINTLARRRRDNKDLRYNIQS